MNHRARAILIGLLAAACILMQAACITAEMDCDPGTVTLGDAMGIAERIECSQ